MSEEKINDTNIVTTPAILNNAPEEVMALYREWFKRYEALHADKSKYFLTHNVDGKEFKLDLTTPIVHIKRILKTVPKSYHAKILRKASVIQKEKARLMSLRKQWMNYQFDPKSKIDVTDSLIVELLGQFKTNEEIIKVVFETFGVMISTNKIKSIKTKNLDKVNKLKSEWEGSYDEFSVTRKRGRIERLVYLLHTQTEQYKQSNTYPIPRSKEIREIIKQIKDEIEGNKIAIDINGTIDVTSTINMNMNLQQLTQRVSLNSFIVAMVAMKRGIDPTKLMNQLQNSYYKAYNGFSQMTPIEADKMIYPSNLINTYDWAAIEAKHKDDKDEVEEVQVIDEQPNPKTVELKNKLLDLMQKKYEESEAAKRVLKKDKK